jgi:LacI family transcriptional regulator
VQHLAALRHERIAFISGPPGLKSADARKRAFQRSMQEIGLAVDDSLITDGNHTIESGVVACAQLLALSNRPTAIMCSNDMTALGVMRKAYEEGITIPQELSVIGFDDIHLAQFVLPALTTVQMSQGELARLAFHALFEDTQREQASPKGTEYMLTTHLVLRESTHLVNKRSIRGKR